MATNKTFKNFDYKKFIVDMKQKAFNNEYLDESNIFRIKLEKIQNIRSTLKESGNYDFGKTSDQSITDLLMALDIFWFYGSDVEYSVNDKFRIYNSQKRTPDDYTILSEKCLEEFYNSYKTQIDKLNKDYDDCESRIEREIDIFGVERMSEFFELYSIVYEALNNPELRFYYGNSSDPVYDLSVNYIIDLCKEYLKNRPQNQLDKKQLVEAIMNHYQSVGFGKIDLDQYLTLEDKGRLYYVQPV